MYKLGINNFKELLSFIVLHRSTIKLRCSTMVLQRSTMVLHCSTMVLRWSLTDVNQCITDSKEMSVNLFLVKLFFSLVLDDSFK